MKTVADGLRKAIDAIATYVELIDDRTDIGGNRINSLTVADGLSKAIDAIATYVGPIIDQFAKWATSSNGLQSVLTQVWNVLQTAFIPIWQTLVEVWQTQLLPAFKEMYDALLPIMPTLQFLGQVIGTVIVIVIILWIKWLGALWTAIAGGVKIVAGFVKILQDIFTGDWKSLGADLLAQFKNVFGGMLGMFQSAEDKAKEAQLQTQIHTSQMKVQSITNAQQMAIGTIQHMKMQKDGILRELAATKDPAKRHHLEMQLHAIDAAQRQEEGVVQHLQQQKVASLKHIQELKDQAIE